MRDPTAVGPPPVPLTGGATPEPNHAPDNAPGWRRKLLARGAGVGAAMTAPILLDRAHTAYHNATDEILRSREDPERVIGARDVMASLDEFLEKKASGPDKPMSVDPKAPMDRWPNKFEMGTHILDHGIKGLAQGAGGAIAEALMAGIGKMVGGAARALYTDPRKKALLQKVITSDPVLSDAVQRSPMMAQNLLEAYGTMNKFAPTLTTDVNAVRSFLREVVLGGGHVNYATIKNLVETEKSLHQDKPWYHGG